MKPVNRRTFVVGGAAGVLSGLRLPAIALSGGAAASTAHPGKFNTIVDFRYAPTTFQSTFCFPDDPAKSIVGEHGDLRYDYVEHSGSSIHDFGTIVEFGLSGMRRPMRYLQRLEQPAVPIVHTTMEHLSPAPTDWSPVTVELTTFATRRRGEGRVDNVLLEIRSRTGRVLAAPLIDIRSSKTCRMTRKKPGLIVVLRDGEAEPWMYCAALNNGQDDAVWRSEGVGYHLHLQHGTANSNEPLRYLLRLPQHGNSHNIETEADPDLLLREVRAWWKDWRAFGGKAAWSLPAKHGEFLIACARDIQQAREVRNGHLTFEVGPTVYRGIWIADGNSLLEAARYLGYDKDADAGLLAEWQKQLPSGQLIAGAGGKDWKDTATAIFTLVRACELKQDWSMLRQLAPQVHRAVAFLIALRNQARKGNSTNGRYGLLLPGFADGGIKGVHSEFTNTLGALAGLRALARANEHLQLKELSEAAPFYRELRAAFDVAAKREMVRDPRGFSYLPMLMHDDPLLRAPTPWDRPRPQSAQWALSQAIFPGQLFDKDDPVVRGHIALMQACTQEDIPAETGWAHHEAVWTYNAAFVAEVYLWAGLLDWAHRTFTGFLNHASPLYAWREEQPLQHALIGELWGDMPHNWASAECVRYLRHRLILEDAENLRLLAGVLPTDWRLREPFSIESTPTRFGRISLSAEPVGSRGWRIQFQRGRGWAPSRVKLPRSLWPTAVLRRMKGASFKAGRSEEEVLVDPAAPEWTAVWSS